MDIEQIKSDLKMKNFYFSKASIERSVAITDGKYQIDVAKHINKVGEHTFNVTITLNVSKDELNIIVETNADFILESDDYSNEEVLINNNTVAIMFPFIRSMVTLITSQPGMSPIILPPINTAKFK